MPKILIVEDNEDNWQILSRRLRRRGYDVVIARDGKQGLTMAKSDKPDVILATPDDPNRTSAFLNVRVADIAKIYEEWSAKGAEFLTEPKDHGREIRAYVRDPDGHLIEVGQTTGLLS